jgi:glucosamine--fructose-6-phosphate aminotransferase (isomerizing)
VCGIAGCVGHEGAPNFVFSALETMESRGYDSAGLAYPSEARIEIIRAMGDLDNLVELVNENPPITDTAIGHIRWATHGRKVLYNAHPHNDEESTVAVVCNGIIENHRELRESLSRDGHEFKSETDTEVIPHLIESYLQEGYEPEDAFEASLSMLRGNYAVLATMSHTPKQLYAAKIGAPLVLGATKSKGYFVASEANALVEKTENIVILDDYELAIVKTDTYESANFMEKRSTTRPPQKIAEIFEEEHKKAELGSYPHYMLKEIHDSAETVQSALAGRVLAEEGIIKLGGLESVQERLEEINRIIIVSCGTSYFAGLIGEKLIEEIAEIPVEVQLASEFGTSPEPISKDTAVLAISQSGETADTLSAMKSAKDRNLLSLGIVNAPGSSIARLTDAGVYCRAGEERSVASTKAFTSQVTLLAEYAMALAKRTNPKIRPLMKELTALPENIKNFLVDTSDIKLIADKYANFDKFLFIGRGYSYPNAKEGALKLKEITYIFAEGVSAGELKHGTIALINEDCPTLAIATNGSEYERTLSNIEEIKARGGPVIAVATEGNETIAEIVDDVIYVPECMEQVQPIMTGIALQLFAYYTAVKLGREIDKPRNLAKSVTVQ